MTFGATSVGPNKEFIAASAESACLAVHHNSALGPDFSAKAIGMVFEQCTGQPPNFATAEVADDLPVTPTNHSAPPSPGVGSFTRGA